MDCVGNIVSGARLVNFPDDGMKLSYECNTISKMAKEFWAAGRMSLKIRDASRRT